MYLIVVLPLHDTAEDYQHRLSRPNPRSRRPAAQGLYFADSCRVLSGMSASIVEVPDDHESCRPTREAIVGNVCADAELCVK